MVITIKYFSKVESLTLFNLPDSFNEIGPINKIKKYIFFY